MSKEQINKLQRIQTECLKLIAHKNKRGNLNKELGVLPIKSKITLENYKFGFKLKNKQLLNKTITLCYLDNNNKSLTKQHKYQTRHKTLPNLPRNVNKVYINSFLCMGPQIIPNITRGNTAQTKHKRFHIIMQKLSLLSTDMICGNLLKQVETISKWKPLL